MKMLAARQLAAALAVLLTFSAYLRPSEALRIEQGDVAPPAAGSPHVAINLHPDERYQRSKVGAANESILLDSVYLPWLGPLLLRLRDHREHATLFQLRYEDLVKVWNLAQDAAGLPTKFVLHPLRHGGPSHDRRWGYRPMLEVKQRGRWSSDASLRRHEAAARIHREESRAGHQVMELANAEEAKLHQALLDASRLMKDDASSRHRGGSWRSSRAHAISARASAGLASHQKGGISTTARTRTSLSARTSSSLRSASSLGTSRSSR